MTGYRQRMTGYCQRHRILLRPEIFVEIVNIDQPGRRTVKTTDDIQLILYNLAPCFPGRGHIG